MASATAPVEPPSEAAPPARRNGELPLLGVALPGHGHLHDRPARKVNIEVESPDDIPKEAT